MIQAIATAAHDAILDMNRRFTQTFNAGDPAGAAALLYTRHACVLPPGGEEIRGREAAQRFWAEIAAHMGITALRLETRELRPLGECVCEIGLGTISAGAVEQTVKYVVVWKQEDGEWKADVDIWN
jgi:ketosteroid isomerase-like protein